MTKPSPKVIEQLPSFKVPESARKVIFLKDIVIKPDKKLQISISKGTIGHSFNIGNIRAFYFKGLNYIILQLDPTNIAYAKDNHAVIYADHVFYKDGKKEYTIYNKTNWLKPFSEKYDDEASINAGKDLYLLKNTDYKSLTPPVFQKIFMDTLIYCEKMEFYEICADLMKFAEDWFTFYEHRFTNNPILKFTKGWGWLYWMNMKENKELELI